MLCAAFFKIKSGKWDYSFHGYGGMKYYFLITVYYLAYFVGVNLNSVNLWWDY